MGEAIKNLSDVSAVKGLSLVAKQWLENRGLEAFIIIDGTRRTAGIDYQALPDWASGPPTSNSDSANFSRRMLAILSESDDSDVRAWTEKALAEVSEAKAQILDPITLSIGGAILIGAILAARVKKIGGVAEFYKGVPKELADVIKVGSTISSPQ
jgi:hypothetical protein